MPGRRSTTDPPDATTETLGVRLEGLLREVIELAKDYGVKVATLDAHATTLDEVTVLLQAIEKQNDEAAALAIAERTDARVERADSRKAWTAILMPIGTAAGGALTTLIITATAYYFGIAPPVPPVPPPTEEAPDVPAP